MDMDSAASTTTTTTTTTTITTTDSKEGDKKTTTEASPTADSSGEKEAPMEIEKAEPAEKKDPEPNFQLLSNPARVLPQQVDFL